MFSKLPKYLTFPLVTLLLSVAVTGCQTFNSQVLDLHPKIQVHRNLPADTRIEIITNDLRPTEIIGFRLTGEQPNPQIILKNTHELLAHTAEHALEDMGIRRFYSGEFRLVVSLVDLNYNVTKKTLKQKVDVDMKIRLQLTKGEKSYTGNYATDKHQTFLKTPTEQDNQKLIGEVVSQTMNRAFNDPQLLDFIQFN
ncbi:MAG: YajG family lipoprotein [Neptuniibacter sp.]